MIYGFFLSLFSIVMTLLLIILGQLSRVFPVLRFLSIGQHQIPLVLFSITLTNLLLYNSPPGKSYHSRHWTFALQSMLVAAYFRALYTCLLMLVDFICFQKYGLELDFCTFLMYL